MRGSSAVITVRSASRPATSPISGRLPRSRSPAQPKTAMRRPRVSVRAKRRAFSRALGVWAKSTMTWGSGAGVSPMVMGSMRPMMLGTAAMPARIAAAGMPCETATATAASRL